MTPEKKKAVIYSVVGVLWPGVIALLVVTLYLIPEMRMNRMLNSGQPYSGLAIAKMGLWIWVLSLGWPVIIASLQKDKRGKP